MAPASTVLNGYTFTPGAEHGVLADEALVAEHDALLAADAAAEVARPADDRAAQPHALAEVGVVVDDARSRSASPRTRTLEPSTVYSPSRAPASTRQ